MLPEEVEQPESPRDEAFWSYFDLAWLIGIAVAGFVAMSGLAGLFIYFYPVLQKSGPFLLGLQFLLYLVLYFGFVFVFKIRHGRPVMQSLGWRRSSFGVGAALGSGVLLAIVVQVIGLLLKTPEKSPIEQFTNTPLSMILVSLTAVGLAPLFEELLFRGFLQPLLTRDLGPVFGILITGCLFGALHLFEYGNLWQYGLAIALVGVTLGYIRLRSGSVIPGTLVHACFNSISVIALIVSKFQKHP
jgi:membrane protease YdiL (CAAX protease family)